MYEIILWGEGGGGGGGVGSHIQNGVCLDGGLFPIQIITVRTQVRLQFYFNKSFPIINCF